MRSFPPAGVCWFSGQLARLGPFALLVSFLAVGCGGAGSGSHIAGRATFKNQPIPAGRIYFDADTAKQNTGPQGFADIKDGQYDTKKGGRGIAGGPTIVRIQGTDGAGKRLFLEYKLQVDLPPGTATKDFDVPAAAAKNLPKDTEPPP